MGGRQVNEQQMLELQWGVKSCAVCGTTIVLGEKSLHARVGDRWEWVCSSCSGAPRKVRGLRRRGTRSSHLAA